MTEPHYSRPESSASSQPVGDIWRKELHAHLARYRTRRGRRIEGAFSMRFPFPPPETAPVDAPPAPPVLAAASPVEEVVAPAALVAETDVPLPAADAAIEPAPGPEPALVEGPPVRAVAAVADVADPEPQPILLARPRSRRKVIAFPKPLETSPYVHRLADPVLPERPRILDVPEELEAFPSTPFLDGLQFGPNPETAPPAEADHVELPLRPATVPQRLVAALLDGAVVAMASFLFAVTSHKMLPKLLFTKPALLTAAAIPALFWGFYQYLMLVYGGRTVGMKMTGIRLRTFKGARATLFQRRNRVLALYLSSASLIMGLLWAFVDTDALCWHDRISRTYLAGRE